MISLKDLPEKQFLGLWVRIRSLPNDSLRTNSLPAMCDPWIDGDHSVFGADQSNQLTDRYTYLTFLAEKILRLLGVKMEEGVEHCASREVEADLKFGQALSGLSRRESYTGFGGFVFNRRVLASLATPHLWQIFRLE